MEEQEDELSWIFDTNDCIEDYDTVFIGDADGKNPEQGILFNVSVGEVIFSISELKKILKYLEH